MFHFYFNLIQVWNAFYSQFFVKGVYLLVCRSSRECTRRWNWNSEVGPFDQLFILCTCLYLDAFLFYCLSHEMGFLGQFSLSLLTIGPQPSFGKDIVSSVTVYLWCYIFGPSQCPIPCYFNEANVDYDYVYNIWISIIETKK